MTGIGTDQQLSEEQRALLDYIQDVIEYADEELIEELDDNGIETVEQFEDATRILIAVVTKINFPLFSFRLFSLNLLINSCIFPLPDLQFACIFK